MNNLGFKRIFATILSFGFVMVSFAFIIIIGGEKLHFLPTNYDDILGRKINPFLFFGIILVIFWSFYETFKEE